MRSRLVGFALFAAGLTVGLAAGHLSAPLVARAQDGATGARPVRHRLIFVRTDDMLTGGKTIPEGCRHDSMRPSRIGNESRVVHGFVLLCEVR